MANQTNIKETSVSLSNLITSSIKMAPDAGHSLKGLFHLLTTKPEQKKSIGRLFEKTAEKYPNNLFIKYEHITYTYEEVNQQANKLAHYLLNQGVKTGDAVAILLENRPEALIAALAVVKIGAISAMLNTSQRGKVLLHSINLIKPKLLLVGEEMLNNMATVEEQLDISLTTQLHYWRDKGHVSCPDYYLDIDLKIDNQSTENLDITKEVKLKQPCFYIFTSGTTGMPKASVMTHFRWFKCMAGVGQSSLKLKSTDTLYISLPFYHNNALTVSLSAIISCGGCIALARKFSVSRFWDDIRRFEATSFCYIGELCRYLLNMQETGQDRQHKVRTIIGNGLRADIWMEFKQRFGIDRINEFYGASECNILFTNVFNLDKTAGFCPLPYKIVAYDPETEEPILNTKGFMQPVKKGETGLLIAAINKRQPFDGYSEKTANDKKIFHNVFKTGDQWFNSGDLVINQGLKHIAFADRLGDTFRWKGENVATTEIESILMNFPNIEHAVVYGVEIPNCDGRAGMATLVLKANENLDYERLSRFLFEKMPAYAIPVFLRISQKIDSTGTFKYQKTALKKQAYHLEEISDEIYTLNMKERVYQKLTQKEYINIQKGIINF